MNADELHQALLAETEPSPGLADRAFAEFPPPDRSRRWVLAVAAVALTVCMVAGLAAAGGRLGLLPLPQTAAAPQPVPAPNAGPVVGKPTARDPVRILTVTPSGAVWLDQAKLSRDDGHGGIPGVAYVSTDGGRHWSPQLAFPGDGGPTEDQMRLDADGNGLLLGPPQSWNPRAPLSKVMYETTDGGAHWASLPPPAGLGAVVDIQLLSGHEAIAVGSTGSPTHPTFAISRTVDGSRTWGLQASIDPARAFGVSLPPCGAKGCEGVDHLAITFVDAWHAITFAPFGRGTYVSSDGGRTWQRVALPPAPPGAGSQVTRDIIPADGGRRVVLVSFYQEPGQGTSQGVTSFSDDGGHHWSASRSMPPRFTQKSGDRLVPVDDADWWASADRTVYFSSDQGQHWTATTPLPQSLTAIEQLEFADRDHGWVIGDPTSAYSPRIMFTTADGGKTWQQVPLP